MLTYADVCRIVAVVSSNESSEDIQVLAYVAYAVLAYVAHAVLACVTCACPPMSPVMTCRYFTTYFTAGTYAGRRGLRRRMLTYADVC